MIVFFIVLLPIIYIMLKDCIRAYRKFGAQNSFQSCNSEECLIWVTNEVLCKTRSHVRMEQMAVYQVWYDTAHDVSRDNATLYLFVCGFRHWVLTRVTQDTLVVADFLLTSMSSLIDHTVVTDARGKYTFHTAVSMRFLRGAVLGWDRYQPQQFVFVGSGSDRIFLFIICGSIGFGGNLSQRRAVECSRGWPAVGEINAPI